MLLINFLFRQQNFIEKRFALLQSKILEKTFCDKVANLNCTDVFDDKQQKVKKTSCEKVADLNHMDVAHEKQGNKVSSVQTNINSKSSVIDYKGDVENLIEIIQSTAESQENIASIQEKRVEDMRKLVNCQKRILDSTRRQVEDQENRRLKQLLLKNESSSEKEVQQHLRELEKSAAAKEKELEVEEQRAYDARLKAKKSRERADLEEKSIRKKYEKLFHTPQNT